jgi:DNA-3-methyladenine glycosylase
VPRAARPFFARDPKTLARDLLGQRLVRILDDGTRLAGLIVETEAYLGVGDRAAHSYGGRRTARNEAMYARPGTAYVYFTYGLHHCFNVVCGREGEPVAVLVRALEPTEGLAAMRELRNGARKGPRTALPATALCSGPARLCQALAIDRGLNAVDLAADAGLFVEVARPGPIARGLIGSSGRIGIEYAGEWAARPLRWFIRGNPHVSAARNRVAAADGLSR